MFFAIMSLTMPTNLLIQVKLNHFCDNKDMICKNFWLIACLRTLQKCSLKTSSFLYAVQYVIT